MTDRKGLLNEIALLTNLLGNESPGTGDQLQKTGKSAHFVHPKRSSTIKPGRFKVQNSSPPKPLSAAAVLALINGGPPTTTSTFKAQNTIAAATANSSPVGFKLASELLECSITSMTGKTSKYRVDRRVRKNSRSRVTETSTNTMRRNSGSNLVSLLSSVQNSRAKRNQTISPLRKYSIRKYSIRQLKSSSVASIPLRTSVLQENRKITGSYSNGHGKGSHQVVQIDGTKYLSKNTGKSLKRIRTSSVPASNFQFQCFSKNKTPSHRSANRVLQRSITTLSGGKRGNRVCYFLKNFGRCKRKENSTCPFFHGLSTTDSNVRKSPTKSVRCRFFRKGECLRPKCHYLHEKDTIRRSETWRPQWQQQVKLARKAASNVSVGFKKRQRKLSEAEQEAIKARYFQSEPEINPLSTIIKRRLPKGVEIGIVDDSYNKPVTPHLVPVPIDDTKRSNNRDTKIVQKIEGENVQTVSLKSSICVDREIKTTEDRRQRLLGKLVTFKERVGRGSSEMPAFLPF